MELNKILEEPATETDEGTELMLQMLEEKLM